MNECKNCKNGCFAGVCTCQCHQKPEQSWESDFDKLYEGYKNLGSPITKQAEIKLFIAEQVREAENRGVVRGLSNNGNITFEPRSEMDKAMYEKGRKEGANEVIDDILKSPVMVQDQHDYIDTCHIHKYKQRELKSKFGGEI